MVYSATDTASELMDDDTLRRLIWSGLLALVGVLASLLANRVAAGVWRQVFNEEPPE